MHQLADQELAIDPLDGGDNCPMESAAEYLDRTESAVRKLFDGITDYVEVLHRAPVPVFVCGSLHGDAFEEAFASYIKDMRILLKL